MNDTRTDVEFARTTPRAARRRSSLVPRFSLIGVWAVLVLGFGLLEPATFFQFGTFQTIFGSQTSLVFIALALLCTLMVGEFDLSPAASFGLAGSVVAVLTVNVGIDPLLASVLAVAATSLAGFVNAVVIVVFKVDPIVTTLGMSTILLGAALGVTDLQSISGIPPAVGEVINLRIVGLPLAFFVGVVVFVLFFYASKFTPLGQYAAFTSANKEVAVLAGVRVDVLRMGGYTFAGFFAGIGGVILAFSLRGFDPVASSSLLLPSLAAVFLGTAVIEPGRFNPIGALIGIYFLQTGVVGLQLIGLSGWAENVFYGGILILAVAVTTFLRKRSAK